MSNPEPRIILGFAEFLLGYWMFYRAVFHNLGRGVTLTVAMILCGLILVIHGSLPICEMVLGGTHD